MAIFKVSCLVLLVAIVSVLSEELDSSLESDGHQDDLEGAETVFLAKKLLLLKGLGLGGLLLLSQKGGMGGLGGGFGGKFGGVGGDSVPVEYGPPAQSYGSYSGNYVAAQAPAPVQYAYPAPAPAPVADVQVAPPQYTGNIQVVGYLQPVPTVQAPAQVVYSNQVETGAYNYPAPAPVPLAPVQPCEH